MRRGLTISLLLALLLAAWSPAAPADKRTVCTITVNSSDEKEAFRRYLPHDKFQFVELVEYGRPDWLASACRRGVRCDMLVISGHFNGEAFFPDTLDFNEHLPIDELERISCSDSCPGLFSRLKEVYLFGCDTLNAQASLSASPEVQRSLQRAGHSRSEAERIERSLRERHGESNRTVMRRLFGDVPVIYGFASFAPVGPLAGPKLSRYFQTASSREVASGRPSQGLLHHFAAHALTVTSGLRASEPHAAYRSQVCQFVDTRQSSAQKLRFIHAILGQGMAQTRMFFERIERFLATLSDAERSQPAVVEALSEIAHDRAARERYLAFARDADRPSIRVRMTAVAQALGWLTRDEQRAELVDMIGHLLAERPMTASEVDLLCTLNKDGAFSAELPRWTAVSTVNVTGRSAALACLGSAEDRPRVLQLLTSPNEAESRMAETYLHHRPIADPAEMRRIVADATASTGRDSQLRAFGTLAKQRIADIETLLELVRLFPIAQSLGVQRAIAGILIRSDYRAIANADTVRALRQSRFRSPDGDDIIDILLRRMDPSPESAGGTLATHSTRRAPSTGGGS